MLLRNRAARNSGNCSTPVTVHGYNKRTFPILPSYERAALIGGLIIAVSFGIMFVYAAVAL